MSRDDLLRETLRRATGGEPSAGDAFLRFGARRRHAAIARGVTVVGIGIATMIALFMLLPGAGGEGIPGAGGTQGTESPQPPSYRTYTDKVANFQISYPDTWGGRRTMGAYVALFPLSIGEDQKTAEYTTSSIGAPEIEEPLRFYVLVRVLDEPQGRARLSDIDAQERSGGVTVERGTAEFDGRHAQKRFLTYTTDEPTEGAQVQTWCARCSIQEYLIDWVGEQVLDVRFVAPDAKTLTSYKADIEYIVLKILIADDKVAA